jgi:hypothetical protein
MLPIITRPVFELEIPSTKKKVEAIPFGVADEKILLFAQESATTETGSERDIILAIKQVIKNCVQDKSFDINSLTTFDLEYMFLKLRARSVNNVIDVSYRDNEDDKLYNFKIDLDEVDMTKGGNVSNTVEIAPGTFIVLKYPSVTIIDGLPDEISTADLIEALVTKCIDKIYDAENVYPSEDYTEEELSTWVEQLDIKSFNKIKEFFLDLPTMYYKLEYTNSLGNKREIELTSLRDFFSWG